MSTRAPYSAINSLGILCPWADQGLGIQCREYYDILQKCGYMVSIYSFKPYHSTPDNLRLQADPNEWDYNNVYYGHNTREEIDAEDFINYLYKYRVSKMIIVETCYPKVFELAKICNMLSIQVVAIPNLETLRYSEIHKHDVFDKILCNNQMTYDILSKYYPNKATLMGFRILNKNFGIDKKWPKFNTMFCSGGLNSLSRKNIDKIIIAFKELENENKIGNFKLYVYIQGVETPTHIERFKSNNIIFSVSQKSYSEIVSLYKKHDIFIHMGDHEGLGLGFYESIACGTPVFTIDTPPNNEIIHDSVNGWVVRCTYSPLNDNKEGIVLKATISVSDIKAKLVEIIQSYNREEMLQSTITDYINRYPIDSYIEQIKKIFS
jgi:glycosyltransferase involved in cell wall biosynthesis